VCVHVPCIYIYIYIYIVVAIWVAAMFHVCVACFLFVRDEVQVVEFRANEVLPVGIIPWIEHNHDFEKIATVHFTVIRIHILQNITKQPSLLSEETFVSTVIYDSSHQ